MMEAGGGGGGGGRSGRGGKNVLPLGAYFFFLLEY